VGQIAYWPPNHDIFIVYAGNGLRVPGPGLIPLGTADWDTPGSSRSA
jgi:hypothetical protein